MEETNPYTIYEIEARSGPKWRRRRKFKTKEQAIAAFDPEKDLCIYEFTYGVLNYGSIAYSSDFSTKVISERRIYG